MLFACMLVALTAATDCSGGDSTPECSERIAVEQP
jgi:hypothetical protein